MQSTDRNRTAVFSIPRLRDQSQVSPKNSDFQAAWGVSIAQSTVSCCGKRKALAMRGRTLDSSEIERQRRSHAADQVASGRAAGICLRSAVRSGQALLRCKKHFDWYRKRN